MRKGRRLAVDVGSVRVGLALCDQEGILASPLPAVKMTEPNSEVLKTIVDLACEYSVLEILVGDPVSLSGRITPSTELARRFAIEINKAIDLPVRLVDERLTTVSAHKKLREAGNTSRESKSMIDSASAVEILEQALSFERLTGNPAGMLTKDFHG
jgi:putative Holliday junction resolvase